MGGDSACTDWERRWQQAFTPGNEHFSGHLPLLATDNKELDRVYYFGALMLISLERTNLGAATACHRFALCVHCLPTLP